MAKKLKKVRMVVEVELNDNLEQQYPNYRFNFPTRASFLAMLKSEINHIVTSKYGAKIKVISQERID